MRRHGRPLVQNTCFFFVFLTIAHMFLTIAHLFLTIAHIYSAICDDVTCEAWWHNYLVAILIYVDIHVPKKLIYYLYTTRAGQYNVLQNKLQNNTFNEYTYIFVITISCNKLLIHFWNERLNFSLYYNNFSVNIYRHSVGLGSSQSHNFLFARLNELCLSKYNLHKILL